MAWQGRLDPDRRGPSGRGQLRHGRFGLAWKSGAWQVEAWHGRLGLSGHGLAGRGAVWHGRRGKSRWVLARLGDLRRGRRGVAGQGWDWTVRAGYGMAWQAWFVMARQAKSGHGMAGAERFGRAGWGGARHGRHGFCFEQCLRRKKWKLKMYVGVIVFQAMGLIQ